MHINYEFKARSSANEELQQLLQQFSPRFAGLDHQVDTYFNVPHGRLKLREGNIEQSLIHYDRTNEAGARVSNVTLYQHRPDPSLKEALVKALGVKVVVDKRRNIYFIDNVKFHFDEVEGLGQFLEVEAIDPDGSIGIEKLKEQCATWAKRFNIKDADYIEHSYSDLLLAKKSSNE